MDKNLINKEKIEKKKQDLERKKLLYGKEQTEIEEILYSYITERFPEIDTDDIEFAEFLRYHIIYMYKKNFSYSEKEFLKKIKEGYCLEYIDSLIMKNDFKKREEPLDLTGTFPYAPGNFPYKMAVQYYDEEGNFMEGTRDAMEYLPIPEIFAKAIVSKRDIALNNEKKEIVHYYRTVFEVEPYINKQKEENSKPNDVDKEEYETGEKKKVAYDEEDIREVINAIISERTSYYEFAASQKAKSADKKLKSIDKPYILLYPKQSQSNTK